MIVRPSPSVCASSLLVVLALVLPESARAAACSDADAVAAARAAVEDACPCADATDRRAYLRCVTGVTKARVDAGLLPKACASSVRRCAKRSSCGRADRVPCCRTSAAGRTTCRVTTAARCTARGGCVGAAGSCCDACGSGACTPTTTSSTTTTVPGPVCGNGRIERGEQCDGEVFCDPQYCYIPFRRCCEIPTDTGVCSIDHTPEADCSFFGATAVTHYGVASTGTETCTSLFPFSEFTTEGGCGTEVATFPPTPLCCDVLEFGLGCTESTASDADALARAQRACSHTSGAQVSFWVSVGTCGPDQHCIPAH